MRPCPECGGVGFIRSAETIAREILHKEFRERFAANAASCRLLRTSADVAGQLMLIGVPDGINAWVLPEPGRPDKRYEIESIDENKLPGKARRLPRFE